MFCGKCGAKIKDCDSFCTKCGTKIDFDENTNQIKDAKVGDIVIFGEYYNDDIHGVLKEPVEWLVLDIEFDADFNFNKVLLLSKNIIDAKVFNKSLFNKSHWEKCELRRWLNDKFCTLAFGNDVKKICETKVIAHKNLKSNTANVEKENDTIDKVFLLSMEEINKYLPTDEKRKAISTKYAQAQYPNNPFDEYWLRTTGYDGLENNGVAAVREDGYIKASGYNEDSILGVRPAIWVKY